MATAWTSYFPLVMPHVPGCPHGQVENAIRDAAIELAERSLLLRSTLTAINIVADQQDYTLTPPANTRVISIINARYDGTIIYPGPEERMDHVTPYWREGGLSLRYYLTEPETISLTWTPKTAITGGLVVRITYKPSRTSTDGDDILFEDWEECIADGALARLLNVADDRAEWRDPIAAYDRKKAFDNGLNQAIFRARMGHTNTAVMAKSNPLR